MLSQLDFNISDIRDFIPKNQLDVLAKIDASNNEVTDNELLTLVDDDRIELPSELINQKVQSEIIRLSSPRIGKGSYPYLGEMSNPSSIPNLKEIERRIESEEKTKAKNSLLEAIKKQFYFLLCTNSDQYSDVRKKWSESFKVLFPVLVAAIASQLGVAVSMISGLIAALLMTIFKLPTNAWCDLNKERYA